MLCRVTIGVTVTSPTENRQPHMRTLLHSFIASLLVAMLALFAIVGGAFAQVQNYVSLDTVISDSAASFSANLPNYILAGLGIFVSLVLFRFGMRLLRRWVH